MRSSSGATTEAEIFVLAYGAEAEFWQRTLGAIPHAAVVPLDGSVMVDVGTLSVVPNPGLRSPPVPLV